MRSRSSVMVLASLAAVVLAWLCCLPRRMFDGVPYSTVVNASDGSLLGARIAADGQWRFPPCDSIPPKFATALVEYEDRRFYRHNGISLPSLARAMWQNLTSGRVVSGASTITMQTVRLHRRGLRNILEKVVEMFMATRLELTHDKDEILRMYVSHAPFGGNVVGIEAATWRYLGHAGNEMSWAEAATLAVLQNAPATVHPSRNRHRPLIKRNSLLRRLYESGKISADEYELAIDEPLIGEPKALPAIAPHLVENFHRSNRGERIASQIDYSLQLRLEDVTASWRAELACSGINDLAAIVVRISDGATVAYCGNADFAADRPGKWVDIARSPRSSGSILKPLLYCAALQEGEILPSTLLPDVPTDFGGFAPKNFDGQFSGAVPADKALALSLNVPAVALLQQYGVQRFASLLHKAGLTTISRPAHTYGLSLILGGAEVTLCDVVNCYAATVKAGPDFPLHDSVSVYSMLRTLREVNRPDQLDYSRISDLQDIAWKTGTSYGGRDGWAVGISRDYVVGVWAGNADGSGVSNLTGARTAGPVMFDIFNLLPSAGKFTEPSAVHKAGVCSRSGHIAGKYCTDTELQTVSAAALRSRQCPYCLEIPVSLDGQRRVNDFSEPSTMRSYFILPPLQQHFYRMHHAGLEEPPAEGHPHIIYPSDGAMVSLPRSEGRVSGIVCKATHTAAAATLFWHLDGRYVASTADIHQLTVSPPPGLHTLTVMDSSGSARTVTFSLI